MTRCPTCGAATAPSYSRTDAPADWLARLHGHDGAHTVPAGSLDAQCGTVPHPLPHGAWERPTRSATPLPSWWARWRSGLRKRHGGDS